MTILDDLSERGDLVVDAGEELLAILEVVVSSQAAVLAVLDLEVAVPEVEPVDETGPVDEIFPDEEPFPDEEMPTEPALPGGPSAPGGPRTPRVRVPEVVGLREERAKSRLNAAGLRFRLTRVHRKQPRGEVVRQAPGGGARVRKGHRVGLWVSKGPKQRKEPTASRDFRGIVSIGKELQRRGFRVTEHPAFGGVSRVHVDDSYHYREMAIDINWPAGGATEQQILCNYGAAFAREVTGVIENLHPCRNRDGRHGGHWHLALTRDAVWRPR